jgi:hypothetical protein
MTMKSPGVALQSGKWSNIILSLLPLVYWVLVISIDWLVPIQTIAPPLLTVGILLFSFFLPLGWMILWALFYIIWVLLVFSHGGLYSFFSDGRHIDALSALFRSIGFSTTAIFSCIFSYELGAVRRKRAFLEQLILRIPVPAIISDINGEIQLLNNKARTLLALSDDENPSVHSYFDLLGPKQSAQGRFISQYLAAFDAGNNRSNVLDIEVRGRQVVADIELMESHPKRLITLINE